jgi:hypothetical protein
VLCTDNEHVHIGRGSFLLTCTSPTWKQTGVTPSIDAEHLLSTLLL